MTTDQLNNYLERALNIIITLEEYASEELALDIEALFQEIKYSDDVDYEIQSLNADIEAQDFDKFGKNKI
jgi:hypothetical protein